MVYGKPQNKVEMVYGKPQNKVEIAVRKKEKRGVGRNREIEKEFLFVSKGDIEI
jgi:hypothetical protein